MEKPALGNVPAIGRSHFVTRCSDDPLDKSPQDIRPRSTADNTPDKSPSINRTLRDRHDFKLLQLVHGLNLSSLSVFYAWRHCHNV